MKVIDNRKCFGFWAGMPTDEITDSFEDFTKYKNTLPKDFIIQHIESLNAWITSERSHDIFTGKAFNFGVYDDGDFTFPVDFLRYYKNYDIGIPPEYENHIKAL